MDRGKLATIILCDVSQDRWNFGTAVTGVVYSLTSMTLDGGTSQICAREKVYVSQPSGAPSVINDFLACPEHLHCLAQPQPRQTFSQLRLQR